MQKERVVFKANKELCSACGLCIRECPQGAITLIWGRADIDPDRCNGCRRCLDFCPQGSIFESERIFPAALMLEVDELKKRAEGIAARIEKLVAGV